MIEFVLLSLPIIGVVVLGRAALWARLFTPRAFFSVMESRGIP